MKIVFSFIIESFRRIAFQIQRLFRSSSTTKNSSRFMSCRKLKKSQRQPTPPAYQHLHTLTQNKRVFILYCPFFPHTFISLRYLYYTTAMFICIQSLTDPLCIFVYSIDSISQWWVRHNWSYRYTRKAENRKKNKPCSTCGCVVIKHVLLSENSLHACVACHRNCAPHRVLRLLMRKKHTHFAQLAEKMET